jgi:hypothetical protein
MALSRIELEIDEIVLHGLPAADPDHIADAVRSELTRLLASGMTHVHTPRAFPVTARLARGGTPRQASAQLGRAIAKDLSMRSDFRAALDVAAATHSRA